MATSSWPCAPGSTASVGNCDGELAAATGKAAIGVRLPDPGMGLDDVVCMVGNLGSWVTPRSRGSWRGLVGEALCRDRIRDIPRVHGQVARRPRPATPTNTSEPGVSG